MYLFENCFLNVRVSNFFLFFLLGDVFISRVFMLKVVDFNIVDFSPWTSSSLTSS